MVNAYRLVAVIAATFVSAPVWSAGLIEVYRQALLDDPQLLEAAANRQANREARPQARALLLPSLSANVTLNRNFDTENDSAISDDERSFNSRTASVNLRQSIFSRANWLQQHRANSVVNQGETDYVSAQQDLIIRVSQRYFDVLSALDDLTFAQADKNAIARQLEQAKQRFEVGLITITDVQEAQARFDSAVAQEIEAQNQVDNAKEALREISGEYDDRFQKLSERMPLRRPKPSSPDAWVEKALGSNPSLRSASYAVDIARQNVRLESAEHYPTLDLNASYSDSNSGTVKSEGGQVSLQLNVPLFQGGAVLSRTREAAFRHEATKEQLEQLQRSIIRQVRDAYRGVLTAISQVKALDQSRTSNRSALEATQAGFEVGTRTIVDVLDAQRDLFRAERDYSQARYSYILSDLSLKRAAGQISEADLERIEAWLR